MVTVQHLTPVALLALLGLSCAPPLGGTMEAYVSPHPFPALVMVEPAVTSWEARPGSTWSLDYEMSVDLRQHEERYGRFTHLIVALSGEQRHDADGRYRAGATSYAVSSNLTTTGMPVERHDGWPRLRILHGKGGTPFEALQEHALPDGDDLRQHNDFRGTLDVEIPADAPEGWYEPRVLLLVRVEGVDDPVHLVQYRENWAESVPDVLPLVRVGEPAEPRLPWVVLGHSSYRGQTGTLPREERGEIELCGRAGFPATAVLPPALYDLSPSLPTLFPHDSMAPVDGGLEVVPYEVPNHIDFGHGKVTARVTYPDGTVRDLGTHPTAGVDILGPMVGSDGIRLDMSETGRYVLEVTGELHDILGRRFIGGGTYDVWIALPLTVSTSCKPGNSFLVGDAYPSKVNVNPALPAHVKVQVDYYPDSDPDRVVHWEAEGTANRFGHFVAYDTPSLVMNEPGEYVSRVTVSYTDSGQRLWMGEQTSSGVIAPHVRELRLHGTRNFPFDIQLFEDWWGAVERFEGRQDLTSSFFSYTPAPLPDPYAPYDPRDTLVIASNGFNESLVEPHLTMSLADPALAARLQEAYTHDSVMIPASIQPPEARWHYLDDVVQVSTDSAAWFPADADHADELPILPMRRDGLHPYAFPEDNEVDAYTYLGVIRPGFPAMTSVHQSDAIGLYWVASPNRFGEHFNVGPNGDLPGDIYRIQAGAVLKDHLTGRNYYDAYSAAVVVVPTEGEATALVAPGERWLLDRNGQQHLVFVTQDTHDTLEVGEWMGMGGLVFPGIEANVEWTVTKPSGEQVTVRGRSNRLGIVRGKPAIPVDEPGLYKAHVQMVYGEYVGNLPGTYDGTFWHCAVEPDAPPVLGTPLGGMTRVDPWYGLRIPLTWPGHLTDVRLNFAVLMPGMVLDQGEVHPQGLSWEYPFSPVHMSVQHPNFDVRDYSNGDWGMADTVVFQFLLEAMDGDRKVVDSLRLVLRDEMLLNGRGLTAMGGPTP